MNIKIVGVPEHFNLPFNLVAEEFPHLYTWQDIPGGTGDMCQALRNNTADVAILLTEGIIKDQHAGNTSIIIDYYVSSPLTWGIHVAATSDFRLISDLDNTKAAISRFGSGSHLMCKVLANREQWPLETLQYEVVANLNGAVDALIADKAQYFLWEKFTTQYLVDKGFFRRIGEIATPWPCFVVAVRAEFYLENKAQVLDLIQKVKQKAIWCKNDESALALFAQRYNLDLAAVKLWRDQTEWFGLRWDEQQAAFLKDKLTEYEII